MGEVGELSAGNAHQLTDLESDCSIFAHDVLGIKISNFQTKVRNILRRGAKAIA